MTLTTIYLHASSCPAPSFRDTERFARLQELMCGERLFLNAQLMQTEVSGRLGISNRTLSRLIDRETGINFSAYVNGYRLREAIRLMGSREYDRLNVEQIAARAGFNSRSVFHRVFREATGQTPARYRARLV